LETRSEEDGREEIAEHTFVHLRNGGREGGREGGLTSCKQAMSALYDSSSFSVRRVRYSE